MNIADNARHAMPKAGNFTITSRLANDVVHFEFIDEGIGISPDLQSHIFDPFVSEGKDHGTGLGMTIVKKIIDEHHAQIEVQSIVGRGTTIHISLPRIQKTREDEKHIGETLAGNY